MTQPVVLITGDEEILVPVLVPVLVLVVVVARARHCRAPSHRKGLHADTSKTRALSLAAAITHACSCIVVFVYVYRHQVWVLSSADGPASRRGFFVLAVRTRNISHGAVVWGAGAPAPTSVMMIIQRRRRRHAA